MSNTSSIYKGVAFHKPLQKWRTQIQINGINTHLGYFKSEQEAARAHDESALEHYGDFANLNVFED